MDIDELKVKAENIKKELDEVQKIIFETDNDRRRNESAQSKKSSLNSKYWKIRENINMIDRCEANIELREVVQKIIDSVDFDWQSFKFFKNATASFVKYDNFRELHVVIDVGQVCDHDVMDVLRNAEKVTGRELVGWFISASTGVNPRLGVGAWLTYNLVFKGEENKHIEV